MTAISRHVIDWDEKGFPCLGSDCPECSATALIVNEWDAIECLTCAWREFGPDDARADFSKWPDESRAIDQDEPGDPPRCGLSAAARIAVAAVLVIAGSLALLWAGTGPTGLAETVRLLVMAAAVAAVVLALSALLPPKGDGDG